MVRRVCRCLQLLSILLGTHTGGSEFRDRMLLVVISTEPVLDRSWAIALGGI